MPDLSVAVNRNDIVVSKPSSQFSVIYRREGRTLVADEVMRRTDPSAEAYPLGSSLEGCIRQGAVAGLALLTFDSLGIGAQESARSDMPLVTGAVLLGGCLGVAPTSL